MSDQPLARKFVYLVAMPVPQPERQCAIERMPGVGRPQLLEWWSARQKLNQQATELQTRLWDSRARIASADSCALRSKLALLSQHIARVSALWEAIYADASAAGASNAGARGFWLPRWRTLGVDDVCEVVVGAAQDNGSAPPPTTPRTVVHCGPSLVLESAGLYAMRAACAQQIAALDVAENGENALVRAIDVLGHAVSACTQVRALVLLRHAAALNGCESMLLSPHYFENWLLNLTRAQAHYCRARLARQQTSPQPSLLSAYFFVTSALCLRAAQRSRPVRPRLEQLARHRQASGALVLAQALYAVHTHAPLAPDADPERPVVYASEGDRSAIEEVPYALLVDALACARVAFVLLEAPARGGPVSRFFDKLLERLVDLHGGFVPALQTALDSERALVIARRSVTYTTAVCASDKISILCKHRAARSASVSLDSKRAYELCVPTRYAS